ncbi:glycoside hydrolase family 15 protein [Kitasatospora mediocidica]|uniref:glycoside hydrolase family 15 protein n=1 Tax=Kitasatospora mediocidica TaxID=58352 RepID=UPI0007C82C87|nr:glycoside hydrolase family 15 protein [Kitasatospora mediocidica]
MLRAPAPFRIEDLALLGNTRSAALVRPDGAINWACMPDFDSPAVFAAMLGGEEYGFWRVGPAVYDGSPPPPADRRQYLGDTMVLRQEWDTDTGVLAVTDFMPGPDVTDNAEPQIIRIIECVSGVVRVASVFRPRTDYGATLPTIQRFNHGTPRLSATTYPHSYWLDGPSHTVNRDGVCRADITLHAHQSIALSLTWKPSNKPAPIPPDAFAELDATVESWEQWARGCTYRGPYREAVVRSTLAIKAMCHPGGGVIAAPTTSLPEQLGGERQWDYRFVWLRDSALAIAALIRLGQLEEARRWRQWLLTTINPERLQPIYRINGDTDLDEEVLDHLPGYEESQPVRIGNGAVGQLQLDVFGELADTLLLAEDAGLPSSPQVDALLLALVSQVELRWREPDEGIWEIRGEARHFTHSKVMCWVAVDRTLRLLERRPGTEAGVLVRLAALREEIHHDVCTRGIDIEHGVFTQYYAGQALDASLLLIPQAGFLPADDKRVIATTEAIQRDLTEHGLVVRYATHEKPGCNVDGLAGHEGAFLACSFWLAENLAAIGRTDEAHELFDRLLALRSDLGLLAEEYDPFAQRQLGNYPQAFSHWSMVDAADRLAPRSRTRRAAPPRPRAAVEQAAPTAVVA